MNILVVGGGGREHALVWKIAQSKLVRKVYCAPGNPGIQDLAECVDIAQNDIDRLLGFAVKNEIDLTVVGPEDPLVNGLADALTAQGLKVFGPGAKAAEIEGSKVFTKNLMEKYGIPTARYAVFTEYEQACEYLAGISYPTVVKADGLAAGKGTIICHNRLDAESALKTIMVEKVFGESGSNVVIEEFMTGEEASIIAITDGENITYLSSAQDHKAIFDNDEGPNTGGMGAYAPAPIVTPELQNRIHAEIVLPTVRAMAKEGRPYRGFLYAGLMISVDGPKVVEFNCRLGDPEAQVLMPLIEDDLVEILYRVAMGKDIDSEIKLRDGWAMCVVLASGGYPGSYDTDIEISGVEQASEENVFVFHAGTKRNGNGKLVTNGGRVLGVTAWADSYTRVRDQAYKVVGRITFDKAYYRKDIGAKAKKYLS